MFTGLGVFKGLGNLGVEVWAMYNICFESYLNIIFHSWLEYYGCRFPFFLAQLAISLIPKSMLKASRYLESLNGFGGFEGFGVFVGFGAFERF